MVVNSRDVPMGYRFRPTEEELISFFLYRKARGKPLPKVVEDRFVERQLYGEEATPWEVLNESDPWEDLEGSNKIVIYVFCKLVRTKNRVSRTAGCGTWDGKAVGIEIKRGRLVIGYKRAFTFKPRKEFEKEAKVHGHWIMHEFSLSKSWTKKNPDLCENYVVCRITKDVRKGVKSVANDSGVVIDSDLDCCCPIKKRKFSIDDEGIVLHKKKKKKGRQEKYFHELIIPGLEDEMNLSTTGGGCLSDNNYECIYESTPLDIQVVEHQEIHPRMKNKDKQVLNPSLADPNPLSGVNIDCCTTKNKHNDLEFIPYYQPSSMDKASGSREASRGSRPSSPPINFLQILVLTFIFLIFG